MHRKPSKLILTSLLPISFGLLGGGPTATAQSWYGGGGYELMRKSCSHCGREVSLSSRVGQQCPHCGAHWSAERRNVTNVPPTWGVKPADSDVQASSTNLDNDDSSAAVASATVEPSDTVSIRSANGQWTIRSDGDGFVDVLDADSTLLFSAEHRGPLSGDQLDASGRLLTIDHQGAVALRSLPNPMPRVIQRNAAGAQFTPDGRVLVRLARAVAFRNAATGKLLPGRLLAHGHGVTIQDVIVSANGALHRNPRL